MKPDKDKDSIGFLSAGKEWLTLGECATFLACTKNTVLNLEKTNSDFPPPNRISPRKTFYNRDLIKQWFETSGGKK